MHRLPEGQRQVEQVFEDVVGALGLVRGNGEDWAANHLPSGAGRVPESRPPGRLRSRDSRCRTVAVLT